MLLHPGRAGRWLECARGGEEEGGGRGTGDYYLLLLLELLLLELLELELLQVLQLLLQQRKRVTPAASLYPQSLELPPNTHTKPARNHPPPTPTGPPTHPISDRSALARVPRQASTGPRPTRFPTAQAALRRGKEDTAAPNSANPGSRRESRFGSRQRGSKVTATRSGSCQAPAALLQVRTTPKQCTLMVCLSACRIPARIIISRVNG